MEKVERMFRAYGDFVFKLDSNFVSQNFKVKKLKILNYGLDSNLKVLPIKAVLLNWKLQVQITLINKNKPTIAIVSIKSIRAI